MRVIFSQKNDFAALTQIVQAITNIKTYSMVILNAKPEYHPDRMLHIAQIFMYTTTVYYYYYYYHHYHYYYYYYYYYHYN